MGAAILFFATVLAGCGSLRDFMLTPEGQEVAGASLGVIDVIGGLIPIPGAGMVDEVLAVIMAAWLGTKTVRGGRNMLKNSEKGRILGSPLDENGVK